MNYTNETVYHDEKNSDNEDSDAESEQSFENLKPRMTPR